MWLRLSADDGCGRRQPLPGDRLVAAASSSDALAACQAELALLKNSNAFRIGRYTTLPVRWLRSVAARFGRGQRGRAGMSEDAAASSQSLLTAYSGVFPPAANSPSAPAWLQQPARQVEGKLRIAIIADEFTASSLAAEPDVDILSLHANDAVATLQSASPDFLLVESAWLGEQGSWSGRLSPAPDETLRSVVSHCRERNIPTVFWNKEDPLHFEAFIECAKLFDVVLTTDADCIAEYRRELGHQRVHPWLFAVQPRVYHPIRGADESARHSRGFFAGAWYGAIGERSNDFLRLAGAFLAESGLDIYDRNARRSLDGKQYPTYLAPLLHDAVAYDALPRLFRQYRAGLNVNSIKRSPTMFARRVLEMIATNVSVYSNYSLALNRLLAPFVVSDDDPVAVHRALHDELRDPDALHHQSRRLAALRHVLQEHGWSRRLRQLLPKINLHWPGQSDAPQIEVVVGPVHDAEVAARVVDELAAQVGVSVRAWVLEDSGLENVPARLRRLTSEQCKASPAELFGASALVAGWSPGDYHGPNYLLDLWLARSFGQADVCGKAAFACIDDTGQIHAADQQLAYRAVDQLQARRALFPAGSWQGSIESLARQLDTAQITAASMISLDSLSYVEGAAGDARAPAVAGDVSNPALAHAPPVDRHDQGELTPEADSELRGIAGRDLAKLFAAGSADSSLVSIAPRGHRMQLVSKDPMPARWISGELPLSELLDGPCDLHLDARPEPGWSIALEGLDADGSVVQSLPLPAGANLRWQPHAAVARARLVLHLRAPGVWHLNALWLGRLQPRVLPLQGGNRVLMVTNIYPAADDLYRNAFVHRRVKAYKARGIDVDVVCINQQRPRGSYLFDGVLVHVCDADTLAATLRHVPYRSVAVHVLDPTLWAAVSEHAAKHRVVVWLHGAEAQPWTRRPFDLADDPVLRSQQIGASDARMQFWKTLLASPPTGLRLVFVSRTFAEEFQQDIGIRLPAERWSVIPNPIDTELFQYREKPVEQRYKVLSIRPHASRVYANDLVASAILSLSAHPLFPRMQFLLVGDGDLFEKNFSPLHGFENVRIERRFVCQEEAAHLYKHHGIFLVPTRGDTHGVSRDEAMACGMVPVTNSVGSVPEFVGVEAGFLVDADDSDALANAVVTLIGDPSKFLKMSLAAALRAGGESAYEGRISAELALLDVCRSTNQESRFK